MDDAGWSKTKKRRIVRNRPIHFFGPKDVVRILGNLIADQQISGYEREMIAKLVRPVAPAAQTISEGSPFWNELREFLLDKVLTIPGFIAKPILGLVELEEEALKDALLRWFSTIK